MPRRPAYGEIVDDHQAELAACLAKDGRIEVAWEVGEFPDKIATITNRRLTFETLQRQPRVVEIVRACIADLLSDK